MINKKKIASNVLYAACAACIVYYATGVIWTENMRMFNINLFSQTRFETKNFIIDLPRFYWIGKYAKEDIFFSGAQINVKNIKQKIPPIISLTHFNSAKAEGLGIICNEYSEKTVEKLDNKDVTVYECIYPDRKDLMNRFIVYKDEALFMFYYVHDMEAFQPLYDKFFEGVKLK